MKPLEIIIGYILTTLAAIFIGGFVIAPFIVALLGLDRPF